MTRYVFADETGDFAFTRDKRASRYFILCTVTMDSCELGDRLLRLRRELIWEGLPVAHYFHACEDRQVIRDRVFALLATGGFTVEATILEKSKAQPQTRTSDERFYQYAWFFHFKGVRNRLSQDIDRLQLTAATIGTAKRQKAFQNAVDDVIRQYYRGKLAVAQHYCPAMADPCLQIADYCTWAVQRRWERGDDRSYEIIRPFVRHEYDSWAHGKVHYY